MADQLTFETDDNRKANQLNAIVDSDGRRIVFYEKEFNSGRLTGGRITDAGGLFVDIEAGTGNLNGTPVAWSQTLGFPVVSALFQIVGYDVNLASLVIVTDLQMTTLNHIIPLAYIFAGVSIIVRVLNIEITGKYIYVRRQIDQGGSVFAYEGVDDLMNSGTTPQAFYDVGTNRIYLTYRKNGMVFQRIIEVGNEASAWNYIVDYNETGGVLVYLETFRNESLLAYSASPPTLKQINTQEAPIVQGNVNLSGTTHIYNVALRSITGFQLVPEFYEIYKEIASVQVLQESIPYSLRDSIKDLSTGYSGTIYLGFRGTRRGVPYVQPESERERIVIAVGEQVSSPGSNLTTSFYRALAGANISGSNAVDVITSTTPQLITILHDETDGPAQADISASSGIEEITSTLPQLNTLLQSELDGPTSADISASAGFASIAP